MIFVGGIRDNSFSIDRFANIEEGEMIKKEDGANFI